MIVETAIEQYERTTGRKVDGTLIETSNVIIEDTSKVVTIETPKDETVKVTLEVAKDETVKVAPEVTLNTSVKKTRKKK